MSKKRYSDAFVGIVEIARLLGRAHIPASPRKSGGLSCFVPVIPDGRKRRGAICCFASQTLSRARESPRCVS